MLLHSRLNLGGLRVLEWQCEKLSRSSSQWNNLLTVKIIKDNHLKSLEIGLKTYSKCRKIYSRKTASSQEEWWVLWHFNWPYFHSLSLLLWVFSLYCRHPQPAVIVRLAATERTELGFLVVKAIVCHQTGLSCVHYFFKYLSVPLSFSFWYFLSPLSLSFSLLSTAPSPRLGATVRG